MKRVASRFNTVVIPGIKYSLAQVSIGVVKGRSFHLSDQMEYELIYNIEEFRTKHTRHMCMSNRFVYYKVTDYYNFDLGDKVTFKNEVFIVVQKEAHLANGLLEATYLLGHEDAFGLTCYHNEKITGMSIPGRVIWTSGEQIKLHLNIDENEPVSAYKYAYVPESGNIMYSMPEIGAQALLYFPSADESDAIVTNCKTNESPNSKFPDNNQKRMLTPNRKQMLLSANEIGYVSQSRTGSHSMDLFDRLGVHLQSSKKIRIHAKKRISLKGNVINMNSTANIHLEQAGGVSSLDISGTQLIFTAPKIVTGGLAHKPVDLPKRSAPSVIDMDQIVNPVLGGLTAGDCSNFASIILAAIPAIVTGKRKISLLTDRITVSR